MFVYFSRFASLAPLYYWCVTVRDIVYDINNLDLFHYSRYWVEVWVLHCVSFNPDGTGILDSISWFLGWEILVLVSEFERWSRRYNHYFENQTNLPGQTGSTGNRLSHRFYKSQKPDVYWTIENQRTDKKIVKTGPFTTN